MLVQHEHSITRRAPRNGLPTHQNRPETHRPPTGLCTHAPSGIVWRRHWR